MDNCRISCQVMADREIFYNDLMIINLYIVLNGAIWHHFLEIRPRPNWSQSEKVSEIKLPLKASCVIVLATDKILEQHVGILSRYVFLPNLAKIN